MMFMSLLLLGSVLISLRMACTLAQPSVACHRAPAALPYAWLAIVRSLIAQVGGGFVVCSARPASYAAPRVAGAMGTTGIFSTSALPHHAFAQTCCLLD